MDKKFNEAIKTVDDITSKQLQRLPELSKKLGEKFANVRKQEKDVYDVLMAIIAREGGDKVAFKDGGRACFITPLEDNRIKIEYRCDFSSTTQLNDAIISKEETTGDNEPIEDFSKLSAELENLERRNAIVALSRNVIDTYISYQNGITNHRTSMIDKIMDDDDQESYW